MKDFYERSINYVRISLTDKCNLKCIYCKPQCIPNVNEVNATMSIKEIGCFIDAYSQLGGNKVRFTGGEPLIVNDIDKYVYEAVRREGIRDVAISTNGILLYDKLDDLKKAGLNRVNISLDTLKADRYERITGNKDFHKIMKAIDKCFEINLLPIKIDVVLMKGINEDEISEFIKFIESYPIEVRFVELMPIGEGRRCFDKMYISASDILKIHPELKLIGHDRGGVAELYRTQRSKGKIGFITSISNKFCSECNRIRLTCDGKIKPCLHNSGEYSISEFLKKAVEDGIESAAFEELKTEITRIVLSKPLMHNITKENDSRSKRAMFQIGG